jgi:hypothetical protein
MSASEIASTIHSMPALAFAFLTNDQLTELKISQLQEDQSKALFKSLSDEEIKGRLALFSIQDVVAAVEGGVLSGRACGQLSGDHINGIELKKVTYEQLDNLFPYRPEEPEKEYDRDCFKKFKSEDVQEAFEKGILQERHIVLISKEQLKDFNFLRLTPKHIEQIFPNPSPEVVTERYSSMMSIYGEQPHWKKTIAKEVLRRQRANNELLKELSEDQREHIKTKLFASSPP